jgi:hypothetical protein
MLEQTFCPYCALAQQVVDGRGRGRGRGRGYASNVG